MKRKSLITSLALTLLIGVSSTAYAANSAKVPEANNSTRQGLGIGRVVKNFRGHNILTNLLKSKGVSEAEITSSLNSGKTLHDILKEKNISDDEIKKYMLDEKIKSIDAAIKDGSITKEQGATIKERIKENSANCTAPGSKMKNSENKRGSGMGNNGHRKGNGMGNGCMNNIVKNNNK